MYNEYRNSYSRSEKLIYYILHLILLNQVIEKIEGEYRIVVRIAGLVFFFGNDRRRLVDIAFQWFTHGSRILPDEDHGICGVSTGKEYLVRGIFFICIETWAAGILGFRCERDQAHQQDRENAAQERVFLFHDKPRLLCKRRNNIFCFRKIIQFMYD